MAINPYFNLYKTNTNEQKLVRDFTSESIQIYGQDVYYVVRDIENEDYLFTEDTLSSFSEKYIIEMYIESFEGFEGDDIISKFGYSIQDRMLLSCSVDRFREEIPLVHPNEGDLIYLPLSNSLFEIKFVEDEQQFYPVGTLPAFKLSCELFRYDNQDFETGVPEIDGVEEQFNLTEDGTNPFSQNDKVQDEANDILIKEPSPFGEY